ncbi:MAG: hypothetical protein ACOC0V_03860, partial [Oceanicaulis sp.]
MAGEGGTGLIDRRALIAGLAAAAAAGCSGGPEFRSSRAVPPANRRVLVFPAHVTLGQRGLSDGFAPRRDW